MLSDGTCEISYYSIDKGNLNELGPLKSKNRLKITSLNIRSLAPKLEQVEVLLSDEKIDLLSLTETWLKPTLSNNLVRIDNFKIYRWDRKLSKRGGGIGALLSVFVCTCGWGGGMYMS